MHEIIALEQKRFARCLCQRIGEAIAKIQACLVAAAFAVVPIGDAGQFRLFRRHRFNRHARAADQVVKPLAGNGIAGSVDDHRCLQVVCSGEAARLGAVGQRAGEARRIGLIAQDGDECGCVDDHRGKDPRSPA